MTAVAMNDFLDRVRHDADLAARLSAAVGVKEGEAAFAAFVGFAAQNGFDIPEGEAAMLHARLTRVAGEEGELADDDLGTVTGGIFGAVRSMFDAIRDVSQVRAPKHRSLTDT